MHELSKPIPIKRKLSCFSLPNEKQFLLFKVNESRGGFWQNITGSVEKGESFKEAAIREIHEETGLEYTPFKLIDLMIENRFRTYKNHS